MSLFPYTLWLLEPPRPPTKHRYHGLPCTKVWNRDFQPSNPSLGLIPKFWCPFLFWCSRVSFSRVPSSKSPLLLATCWEENHRIKPTHRKVRITSKNTGTLCVWKEDTGAISQGARALLWGAPCAHARHWPVVPRGRELSFSARQLFPSALWTLSSIK